MLFQTSKESLIHPLKGHLIIWEKTDVKQIITESYHNKIHCILE